MAEAGKKPSDLQWPAFGALKLAEELSGRRDWSRPHRLNRSDQQQRRIDLAASRARDPKKRPVAGHMRQSVSQPPLSEADNRVSDNAVVEKSITPKYPGGQSWDLVKARNYQKSLQDRVYGLRNSYEPRPALIRAIKDQSSLPLRYHSPVGARMLGQRHGFRQLTPRTQVGRLLDVRDPKQVEQGRTGTIAPWSPAAALRGTGQAVVPALSPIQRHVMTREIRRRVRPVDQGRGWKLKLKDFAEGIGHPAITNHEFEHAFEQAEVPESIVETAPTIGDLVFRGEQFNREEGKPLQHQVHLPGKQHDIQWMINQAKEHDYFKGRSMQNLIFGTPEGQSWYKQMLESTDKPISKRPSHPEHPSRKRWVRSTPSRAALIQGAGKKTDYDPAAASEALKGPAAEFLQQFKTDGKEGAVNDALEKLLNAKGESDRKNYPAKHNILRDMIKRDPGSFRIDSEEGGIYGLTHAPTGFKIHMPKAAAPPELRANERHVRVDVGDAKGKKLLHHFIRDNKWGSPAGRIEEGEDPAQAAVRELLERTGYEGVPEDLSPRGIDDGTHVYSVALEKLKQVAKPGERGGYSTKIKLAADKAKHVLVTGHSGSGKTTLSKQLAEELGLPLFGLDDDPRWDKLISDREMGDVARNTPGTPANIRFNKVRKQMVLDALARAKPHVIEGTQIAGSPEVWKDHRLVHVDTPELQVVRQRLGRDRLKPRRAGKMPPGSPMARERARIARVLIGGMRDELAQVAKDPRWERMRAKKASVLDGVVEKQAEGDPEAPRQISHLAVPAVVSQRIVDDAAKGGMVERAANLAMGRPSKTVITPEVAGRRLKSILSPSERAQPNLLQNILTGGALGRLRQESARLSAQRPGLKPVYRSDDTLAGQVEKYYRNIPGGFDRAVSEALEAQKRRTPRRELASLGRAGGVQRRLAQFPTWKGKDITLSTPNYWIPTQAMELAGVGGFTTNRGDYIVSSIGRRRPRTLTELKANLEPTERSGQTQRFLPFGPGKVIPWEQVNREHELSHVAYGSDRSTSPRLFRPGSYQPAGNTGDSTSYQYMSTPTEMSPRIAEIKRGYAATTGNLVNDAASARAALKWWGEQLEKQPRLGSWRKEDFDRLMADPEERRVMGIHMQEIVQNEPQQGAPGMPDQKIAVASALNAIGVKTNSPGFQAENPHVARARRLLDYRRPTVEALPNVSAPVPKKGPVSTYDKSVTGIKNFIKSLPDSDEVWPVVASGGRSKTEQSRGAALDRALSAPWVRDLQGNAEMTKLRQRTIIEQGRWAREQRLAQPYVEPLEHRQPMSSARWLRSLIDPSLASPSARNFGLRSGWSHRRIDRLPSDFPPRKSVHLPTVLQPVRTWPAGPSRRFLDAFAPGHDAPAVAPIIRGRPR